MGSGHLLVAIICSLSLILTLFHSPKWLVTVALTLGVAAFLSHFQETSRHRYVENLLARYSTTSFRVEVDRAKVLDVVQLTDGYSAKVRVLSEDTTLHGIGGHIPRGAHLRVFSADLLHVGEVIRFTGYTKRTWNYRNFGAVDWSKLRRKRGEAGAVALVSHERLYWSRLRESEYKLRKSLKEALTHSMLVGLPENSPCHDILPAVLFGETRANQEWMLPYRDAGVMHLFVVSGLHVGMVMGGVWVILYMLPVSTRKVAVLSLALAWGYAWVSGLNPPVVRSVLVITIYVSSLVIRRRGDALNSLLVALLVVILLNHYALYDIGVWLSFGVVLGLIVFGRLILSRGKNWFAPDPYLPRSLWSVGQRKRYSLLKWGTGFAITSLVAWLVSSLIMAVCFNKIYLYGVLAGWLILPALFTMMILSGIVMVLCPFFTESLSHLNRVNHFLSMYVTSVAENVGRLPLSVVHLKDYGYRNNVTVFHLPKGGSAIYVGTEQGILIDTGTEQSAASILSPIFQRVGVEVGEIILSHQDTAHNGGVTVFDQAKIVRAYDGRRRLQESA